MNSRPVPIPGKPEMASASISSKDAVYFDGVTKVMTAPRKEQGAAFSSSSSFDARDVMRCVYFYNYC